MYKLNTVKIKSLDDVKALLDALSISIGEACEDFDNVKYLLDIPEKKTKSYEEYQKEYEEKYTELLEKTKARFLQSKQKSEYFYDSKFDAIYHNFEYAKKNGSFMPTLTVGYGITKSCLANSQIFNFNTNNAVGYWEIQPQVYFYVRKKPSQITRFFAKQLFGFKWNDT